MEPKEGNKATDSSKAEVGEIDTSAPFQSVKHAVSLFGAVRFTRKRPTTTTSLVEPHSAEENIVAKETRLHLAQKELEKLKEQLQNANAGKNQALKQLEGAKKAVEDLQNKFLIASKSKDTTVEDAKMSTIQVKPLESENAEAAVSIWRESSHSFRDQYLAAISELNNAKKELTKIRQDYEASQESKLYSLKQASEAEAAANENLNISSELSKKILALKDSILQERFASEKAQKDKEIILFEKDIQRQAYKTKIDASARQLQDLKKELTPDLLCTKLQLESRLTDIDALQLEIKNAKVSDLASVRDVALELGNAKEVLQEVNKEEIYLNFLVESLTLELVNVKNEVANLTNEEAELEYFAENLHVKLRKGKSELENCAVEEFRLRSSSDELISTLSQLSNECEGAMREVQHANEEIEELRKETEANRNLSEKGMQNLIGLMQEAEVAKSAEAAVLDQIQLHSKRTESVRSSLSGSGAKLKLSNQEFGSLKRKVKESNTITEMKVAAAMAQVEALKASENELINKLCSAQRELEDLQIATADGMKRAGNSEAAKTVLEGELHRLRDVELRKAAKGASEPPVKDSEWSTEHHEIQKSIPLEKMLGETWKYHNGGATLSKNALLPNLSGIFHRK